MDGSVSFRDPGSFPPVSALLDRIDYGTAPSWLVELFGPFGVSRTGFLHVRMYFIGVGFIAFAQLSLAWKDCDSQFSGHPFPCKLLLTIAFVLEEDQNL